MGFSFLPFTFFEIKIPEKTPTTEREVKINKNCQLISTLSIAEKKPNKEFMAMKIGRASCRERV